jgi:hypothetical protein
VNGAPREQTGVELRRRRGPRPGAHEGKRTNSFRVAHREAQAGWAAPVVAHHCQTAQIELVDEAGEIGDMPVETMRLLAGRLLGQAETDHVGDDDAMSRIDQRRDDAAVEKAPGRITVQEQDGIAAALIDIVHSPAVDPGVACGEGPLARETPRGFQEGLQSSPPPHAGAQPNNAQTISPKCLTPRRR